MTKRRDFSVVIMVLVIVAVAVLGGFAIAPTIKTSLDEKNAQQITERMMNGTATVADYADMSGMEIDEFLAQYGLTADDAGENENIMTLAEKMTLENYCSFMGLTYTDEALEAYKAENEDAKDITKDTKDTEQKAAFASYLQAQQAAAEEAAAAETETEELTEEEKQEIIDAANETAEETAAEAE